MWTFLAKKDELHVGLGIPKPIAIEIHNWAEEQDWPEGTELEPIEEYHITLLYAPEGHAHKDDEWMDHEAHAVSIKGIKAFPSKEREPKDAIVLTVESETAAEHHEELAQGAEDAGIKISPFSYDDFKPHITIAYGTLPDGLKPPQLTFETEKSTVSLPRTASQSLVMYHVAPQAARSSIEQHGIDATRGISPWGHRSQGVHLYSDLEAAHDYGRQELPDYDIWQVDAGNLPLMSSPETLPQEQYSPNSSFIRWHTPHAIDKQRIQRVGRSDVPYLDELMKFADSWNPKDQWPNALRERSADPTGVDCTCKEGHKLDCPVHGMHPSLPTHDDTLEFPDPTSPVGYDYHTEAPRTWMRAETKFKKAKHKKLWVDDTRHPPDDSWDWARNVSEAIELTKGPPGEPKAGYEHMSLDHDLGIVRYEGKVVVNPDALDGGDFVLWLHEHGDKKHMPKSVNIHSHNKHAIELMVKALEPHTEVTTKRAPDELEEDWAREFKVHEPSAIERESIDLPERRYHTSSHQLAWLPGSNLKGKGLVTPSGDVHTWPVDVEGMPHHAEYVDQHQPYQLHEGTAHFFQIRPRGGLDTKGYTIPPNIIQHVLETVPSLRAGEHTDWHFGAHEMVMYHVTPSENRAHIKTWGLFPSTPAHNPQWKGQEDYVAEQPHGVYLSEKPTYWRAMANPKGVDMWRVRVDSSRLAPDPGYSGAWLHAGQIGPDQLELHTPMGYGPGDQERDMWRTWPGQEKPSVHELSERARAAREASDQWDTREYPDALMMPPTTMEEPAQSNPHPEKQGCTCEQGHKLDCPVHGLHPTEQGYDHSWSIPQGHPVGYPQDQPRNYMKAEGSAVVEDRRKKDDPESHSQPDDPRMAQNADDRREGNEKKSIRIDHEPSLACGCEQCKHALEHEWHFQSPGTSDGGWSGLPRAEGAVEDEDEHKDNLEGDGAVMPKAPGEIRKKRKEQEDLELVQEKPLLHSGAWQMILPASPPSKRGT